jgi:hypothetical protein
VESPPVSSDHPDRLARIARLAANLRIEDWLLVAWIGLVAPLAGRLEGSGGPFDPDRPIQGSLALIAVLGALACLITGRSDAPPDSDSSVLGRASIGPLVGGLLLVLVAGTSGVSLSGLPGDAATVAGIVILVVIRLRWPALPTVTRRLLVTPFILVTGGIFWSIVDSVAGGASLLGVTAGTSLSEVAFEVGVLAAFSGVYYAMLIYAPRQVAEPEGGPLTWLIRYSVFLASVVVGVAWLRPLGL